LPRRFREPWSQLLVALRPYVRHSGDHRRPAWRIKARKLLDYLLVYIAEGTGRFTIDGVEHDARPGDLFWIPPDTSHDMEGFPPSMDCPFVHFDLVYRPGDSRWEGSIPAGTLDLRSFGRRLHPPLRHPLIAGLKGRIRGHTNDRVGKLVREVVAEQRRAQPWCELRLSGMILEIVAEILRGRSGLPVAQHEHVPLIEEAAAHMRDHASETVRVEEMARFCELSPSHFRELFRRHFGLSPREYLCRARVGRAKELMIGSPLNLTEIAKRSGFASVHGLSRAFRSAEGIAPSQYRRCGARPEDRFIEET
jgi:AraC-like DNA-binding protein